MTAPYNDSSKSVTALWKEHETVTRAFDLNPPGSMGAKAVGYAIQFEAGSGGDAGTLDLDVEFQDSEGNWKTSSDLLLNKVATGTDEGSYFGRPLRAVATIVATGGLSAPTAADTANAFTFIANPYHGETIEISDGITRRTVRIAFYTTAGRTGTADPAQVDDPEGGLWYCPITGEEGVTYASGDGVTEITGTRNALITTLAAIKTAGYHRVSNVAHVSQYFRISATHDVVGTIGNSAVYKVSSRGSINSSDSALTGGTGTATTVSLDVWTS